jgi:hypothetical protein
MEKEIVLNRSLAVVVSAVRAIAVLALVLLPLKGYALEVGDKAPDFHFLNRAGKDISYAADIKGIKPLYLVFWTTW